MHALGMPSFVGFPLVHVVFCCRQSVYLYLRDKDTKPERSLMKSFISIKRDEASAHNAILSVCVQ